jgi:preprotein translocase subunit SecE
MAEKVKIAVAALIAVAGMFAFYALIENGRTFLAFSRESWEEAKRVVWPTRKETLQTTGVVFVFVFTMALFLWMVDTGLLWITQKVLGSGS